MRKSKTILKFLLLLVLVLSALCVPAFALDESEVEAAVSASSKEAVTGNVLIWFLCAVAFLKVSQKVDSFMASLGVNVGHTGGSMLSDAMLTFRAITMATGGANRVLGGGQRGAGLSSFVGSGSAGIGGSFKGGLIGMAGRKITNSAVKTATSQTSVIHAAHKQGEAAAHTASERQAATETHTDSAILSGSIVHTDSISQMDNQTETNNAVYQEGVIDTGHTPIPAVPLPTDGIPLSDNIPSLDTTSVGSTCQQEETIITGDNILPIPPAQTDSIPASDSSIQSDLIVPQEGAILTNSKDQSNSEVQSSGVIQTKGQTDSVLQQNDSEHHAVNLTRSVENSQRSTHSILPVRLPTLGGKIFSNSLQSGGRFANDVIGIVARGDMRSTGSITGDLAAQSLHSYMGHTALGTVEKATEKVTYSQVEIGGGRITGREVTPEYPQGIEFAMYHVDQYAKPEGDYQKVFSADGTQWYKQHAVDTVTKTPYKAPDGEIAYNQEIVKRLPTPPKRKDRM